MGGHPSTFSLFIWHTHTMHHITTTTTTTTILFFTHSFFHPTFGEWRCVWGDEGWGRKAGSRASYILCGIHVERAEREPREEGREHYKHILER